MQTKPRLPVPRRQRGAALVIGLLLLLVITLLAVSGMNSSSLELAMAGNTQYHQNAFQAAETGIAQMLVTGTFNPSGGAVGPATADIPDSETGDTYTTTIRPQLSGSAQPALWGSSWDSFSTYHFEIESRGTSARNAQATNVQGLAVIAPADSTITPGGGSTTLE